MGGLKQLYSGQEKGYFDLYNLSVHMFGVQFPRKDILNILIFLFTFIFKFKQPVFGRQIIDTRLHTQFRHQMVTTVNAEQFTESMGLFCRTIGNGILIFVSKIIYSIGTSRYTVWQFTFTQSVSTKQAFEIVPFF